MGQIGQAIDHRTGATAAGRRNACVFVLVVTLALLPLLVAPAAAAMDGETASRFIERLGREAFASLQQPGMTPAQREEAFGRTLRKGFDLELIGRFALGKHWRQATPSERADYLDVFTRFVIKTYAHRLRDFAARGFAVTGTAAGAKGDVLVLTRIERSGAAAVQAGWRVREIDGAPKIIDVVVEGVSMTITQRHEFASVTRRGGIEMLVRSLRLQAAKLSTSAG